MAHAILHNPETAGRGIRTLIDRIPDPALAQRAQAGAARLLPFIDTTTSAVLRDVPASLVPHTAEWLAWGPFWARMSQGSQSMTPDSPGTGRGALDPAWTPLHTHRGHRPLDPRDALQTMLALGLEGADPVIARRRAWRASQHQDPPRVSAPVGRPLRLADTILALSPALRREVQDEVTRYVAKHSGGVSARLLRQHVQRTITRLTSRR